MDGHLKLTLQISVVMPTRIADVQLAGKISYPPRQVRVDSFRCLFQTIVNPTSVIPDVMQKLDPAKLLNTIQLDGIGSRRTGGSWIVWARAVWSRVPG